MKLRRWVSVSLAAALALSAAAPSAVEAKETQMVKTGEVSQADGGFGELPGNGELFAGYVDRLFYGESGISTLGDYGADRLSGTDLHVYTVLKDRIGKIAAGELASTSITVPFEDTVMAKTEWTAGDLGLNRFDSPQQAMNAWCDMYFPDTKLLQSCLTADCPLEMFWYDKTSGFAMNNELGFILRGDRLEVRGLEQGLIFEFSVAMEYQDRSAPDPTLAVDASLLQTVQAAADNARNIVRKNRYKQDFAKLDAYREEICRLTSYNESAAEEPDTPYGNPWQMIWVFDGDPDTNVVCEGYAKAFQYLCDLSDFTSPDICCYTVTGAMDGGTGAGGHMWNIVTMDDKKNYLADITNCDEGTIGADDLLFLCGAQGSVSGGYNVSAPGGRIVYAYDADQGYGPNMPELYGDILTLSAAKYEYKAPQGIVASGKYGEAISWVLKEGGTLQITGTGMMPDADAQEEEFWETVPWDAYRADIKRVEIGEGITGIGMAAFFNCPNLEAAVLPDSLEQIGAAAFAGCGQLKNITFGPRLAYIVDMAFELCTGLTEIKIPESVAYIGSRAFRMCEGLKDVWFDGGLPEQFDNTAFAENTLTFHISNAYKEEWKDLMDADLGGAKITWSFFCISHTWETEYRVDREADCTAAGSESIHCVFCDAVKDAREIPKKDHTWETEYRVDQEAGCTAAGSESLHCAACGTVKETREIPPKGHSITKTHAVTATCATPGNIEYYTCGTCHKLFRDAGGASELTAADTVVYAEHRYETVFIQATPSQDGGIAKKCASCGSILEQQIIYSPKAATLAADAYTYTGKEIRPAVTVTDSSGNPVAPGSYTVSYSNNKEVGTAAISVTFSGNYSGTLTKTFVINPKGTSISKLKSKAKGMTIQWKKQASQTSGYQIQYALKRNFKGAKTIKIGNSKTKTKTISKLKSKTKYYVRIRTFKKVKGTLYFSGWSKDKNIKIK